MSDETIEKAVIDPNLDSYGQFFNHDWCRRTFAAVRSSPLKSAVDSLMVSWRASNGAHQLPSLMISSLGSIAGGASEGVALFRARYCELIVKGLVTRLADRMQPSLKPDQRTKMRRIVRQIERDAFEAAKATDAEAGRLIKSYWSQLVTTPEFQLSILGTQRNNYASVFFAYEDFLASVIRTREPAYSSKKVVIKDAFAKHFGDAIRDECWGHEEVVLANLVRNVLAHNGGRRGVELEKFAARFTEVGEGGTPEIRGKTFLLSRGKIQITPLNTKHLFDALSERVTHIVDKLA